MEIGHDAQLRDTANLWLQEIHILFTYDKTRRY